MQLRSGKDDETLVKEIGAKTAKLFPSFLFWMSYWQQTSRVCWEVFLAMELYRDSLLVHSLALFHVLLQVLCISHLVTFLHFLLLAKMKNICVLV